MPLDFLSPLHKASRQLTVFIETRLANNEVSTTEGHILTYLNAYSPAPVGELVRVFGIKQSTLTSMLNRLEDDGLITREINPEDRRSILIQIKTKGGKIADSINELLSDTEGKIKKRVSKRDIEGFHAVTDAIEEITDVNLRSR